MTGEELSQVITALATLVVAATGMVAAVGVIMNYKATRRVERTTDRTDQTTTRVEHTTDRTQQDVRTLNEQTIGELSAADETRRIEEKPPDDRTAMEKRHLRDMGDRER